MKVLAIVALFAFVAVQLSHSAPAPEDKKEEPASSPAAAVEASSAPAVKAVSEEPKSVSVPASSVAPAAAPAAAPVAEAKKP